MQIAHNTALPTAFENELKNTALRSFGVNATAGIAWILLPNAARTVSSSVRAVRATKTYVMNFGHGTSSTSAANTMHVKADRIATALNVGFGSIDPTVGEYIRPRQMRNMRNCWSAHRMHAIAIAIESQSGIGLTRIRRMNV